MYEAHKTGVLEAGEEFTPEVVEGALAAVAEDVFPHRALFYQKGWMQHGMKKPRALTTRQAVASLIKINNSLPFFPGATEADKFTEAELLQVMEWMIPHEFRSKFEEKGFIPTDHDRKKFIEEAEIVERHQVLQSKPPYQPKKQEEKKKSRGGRAKGKFREKSQGKYCSHHGANKGHNSEDCWTLHPEKKPKNPRGSGLSNKKLKKEINSMARSSNKTQAEVAQMKIDQLTRAKKAFEKRDKKQEQQLIEAQEMDSSDSSLSIHMMENDKIPRKKRSEAKAPPEVIDLQIQEENDLKLPPKEEVEESDSVIMVDRRSAYEEMVAFPDPKPPKRTKKVADMTGKEKAEWEEQRKAYVKAFKDNVAKRWAARDKRLAEEASKPKAEFKLTPEEEAYPDPPIPRYYKRVADMTPKEREEANEIGAKYAAECRANDARREAAKKKRLAEEAEKAAGPKKRPSIEEIRAFTKEYGEALQEKKRRHDEEQQMRAEKKRKAMTLLEKVNPDQATYQKKLEAFKKTILGDQFSPEEQEFQAKSKEMHDEIELSSDE